jgi:hypothetical protein
LETFPNIIAITSTDETSDELESFAREDKWTHVKRTVVDLSFVSLKTKNFTSLVLSAVAKGVASTPGCTPTSAITWTGWPIGFNVNLYELKIVIKPKIKYN